MDHGTPGTLKMARHCNTNIIFHSLCCVVPWVHDQDMEAESAITQKTAGSEKIKEKYKVNYFVSG